MIKIKFYFTVPVVVELSIINLKNQYSFMAILKAMDRLNIQRPKILLKNIYLIIRLKILK